jgi:hypothetical protein
MAKTPFAIELTKSSPVKDTSVTSATSIKLWFSAKPDVKKSTITLAGPDGKEVKLGKVSLAAAAKSPLTASIPTKLAAGTYTVTWTTAGADGAAANGSFGFTIKAAAMKAPTATPTRSGGGRGAGGGGRGGGM